MESILSSLNLDFVQKFQRSCRGNNSLNENLLVTLIDAER